MNNILLHKIRAIIFKYISIFPNIFPNKWYHYFILLFLINIIKITQVNKFIKFRGKGSIENALLTDIKSGDPYSYIKPIDNYITYKRYFIVDLVGDTLYAGRMPYVGITYYLFRTLNFSKPHALYAYIILQTILESVSILLMGHLLKKITLTNITMYVYFIILTFSTRLTEYSSQILSDSIAASFMCFFSYFYYIYCSKKIKFLLPISGTFLALSVLFRPHFSLMYIVLFAHWCLQEYKLNTQNATSTILKNIIRKSFIFALPLLVINAPWTIRNYTLLNKWILFQQDVSAGNKYNPAYLEIYIMTVKLGSFDDNMSIPSLRSFFFSNDTNLHSIHTLDSNIFGESLHPSDLLNLQKNWQAFKRLYVDTINDNVSILHKKEFSTEEQILYQEIKKDCRDIIMKYKKDHPLHYYLLNKIKKLILQHEYPNKSYYRIIYEKSYKNFSWHYIPLFFLQPIIHYIIYIFGLIGLFLFPKSCTFHFTIIHFLLIFLFTFIFYLSHEYRYIVLSYPYIVMGCIYVFYKKYSYIKNYLYLKN